MMKTMKISKYLSMAALGILAFGFNSCENGNQEFPDYEGGTTVYYPYQYIERSVVLGNDENRDNTDDNNHVLYIVSTMGGAYNGKNITLNVDVDNSLCDNLYFEDGVTPVKPMPSNYYTIPTKTVAYNGKLQGRLQVKLEDAFFADPDCAKNTYVIPVCIKEWWEPIIFFRVLLSLQVQLLFVLMLQLGLLLLRIISFIALGL